MAIPVIQWVLIAGAVVLVAAGIAFDIFCLYALARTRRTRYLPKWAWALVICASGLGGFIFLAAGIGD